MRHALALLLPLAAALSAPAAEAPALRVVRADLRFSRESARLDLVGDLLAEPGDDMGTLRVTVGTTVVLDAAAASDRAKERTNLLGDVRLRDPSHLGEGCRLRLKVRPASGWFRLRLSGFDGAAILAAGPGAVPVRVEVSGRTAEATVPFTVRSPRRWAWRSEDRTHVGPGQQPGEPPVPPPPAPGPEPLSWRMVGYGGNSGITTPTKAVIRNDGAYQAFWNLHAPGTQVPAVDFSREMVLVYIAGPGGISNRVIIRGEIVNGVLVLRGEPSRPVWWDANVSPFCIYVSNRNDLQVVWQ